MWGGLPIPILAGDDYQLPGIHEDAFEATLQSNGLKMTQLGRCTFRECANTVFQLETIRQVCDNKQDDKDLLSRICIGDSIQVANFEKISPYTLTIFAMFMDPQWY